ncbi:MAG: aminoacyl-tRNA hydrolase, partial [Actinomycetota bacterium]|nr:aminoacyl-tRNA hydrolase [Actinomycetota bacterium]
MPLRRRGERASTLDVLVAGLGNPGREYASTRHNVGFMVCDELARRHGGSFRSKFSGELAELRIDGARVALLKPLTFMNESGRAVGEAMRFYRLAPADVVVFHDELDLPPGKLRVKTGGGHAGHNGLRSITAHIGAEFRRVRLGIGHPG